MAGPATMADREANQTAATRITKGPRIARPFHLCGMLGRQPSSTRTDSCNSRFWTKRGVLGGVGVRRGTSGRIPRHSFPGLSRRDPLFKKGYPPKTAFLARRARIPCRTPPTRRYPTARSGQDGRKSWDKIAGARTAINPASNAASVPRAQKSPAPDKPRVNPPRKVGARSQLSGFRINGHESPFHRLS